MPSTRAASRILLIDRDERTFASTRAALSGLVPDVEAFADADLAHHAFAREPGAYAAAVIGAVMPKVSGLECAHELREVRPDLPVVLTASASIARYLNALWPRPFQRALHRDDLREGLRQILR